MRAPLLASCAKENTSMRIDLLQAHSVQRWASTLITTILRRCKIVMWKRAATEDGMLVQTGGVGQLAMI